MASDPPPFGGGVAEGRCGGRSTSPRRRPGVAWSWLFVFALFLAITCCGPILDEWACGGGAQTALAFNGTLLAMLGPIRCSPMRCGAAARDFIAVAYRFSAELLPSCCC